MDGVSIMIRYCRVVNSAIVSEPMELPPLASLSNPSAAPVAVLKSLGWWPVTPATLPEFDPVTQRLVFWYELSTTHVLERVVVETLSSQDQLANLVAAKATAIAKVNFDAGVCRQKFMTDIPGQESTYLIKEDEARRFLSVEDPDPNDFPILNAEATACGWTLEYTVNYVMTTAMMFRQIAATVEGLRRGAITKIEQATTSSAITALAQINWP